MNVISTEARAKLDSRLDLVETELRVLALNLNSIEMNRSAYNILELVQVVQKVKVDLHKMDFKRK